jgi:SH3-like domain-containing protein
MEGYRGQLYGRADDGPELFATTTTLNIRKGPAVAFDPVPGSPLAPGTEVEVIERSDLWWHVLTTGTTIEGWVHSRFLRGV